MTTITRKHDRLDKTASRKLKAWIAYSFAAKTTKKNLHFA